MTSRTYTKQPESWELGHEQEKEMVAFISKDNQRFEIEADVLRRERYVVPWVSS